MYFLINYSRRDRKLLDLIEFADSTLAAQAKLAAEIEALESQVRTEIVILEADSLQDLKSSHSRYFGDLSSIQIDD